MNNQGLWFHHIYQQTAFIILAFLTFVGVLLFFLKKRSPVFMAAWASTTSWFIAAPVLLLAFGLKAPYPLVFLTFVGVLSSKTFFQMVGMYHRSWFVWTTYIFIFALGHIINNNQTEYYNLTPMIYLGTICLIPVVRNSASHMIQYLALSLMAFIFWGWSLMHLGRLMMLENGVFTVLYLYILSEFSEHVSLSITRLFGKIKPFDRISVKITVEGIIISTLLTLLLAWGMRHLLPVRTEKFWIAAGLIAAIVGRLGDLTLSVIRRDLGIKSTGVFIIGRDDILARVDKLMFVGPLYYYTYLFLQNHL